MKRKLRLILLGILIVVELVACKEKDKPNDMVFKEETKDTVVVSEDIKECEDIDDTDAYEYAKLERLLQCIKKETE